MVIPYSSSAARFRPRPRCCPYVELCFGIGIKVNTRAQSVLQPFVARLVEAVTEIESAARTTRRRGVRVGAASLPSWQCEEDWVR